MRETLSRAAFIAAVAAALIVLVSSATLAETKPPAAFGAPAERQAAPPAFASPQAAPLQATGPFGLVLSWVAQTQQKMQRQLATAVKGLKSGNAVGAGLVLAGLSFIYGVVHAVGPGHGKAIISSYVVANEETVRRGIVISFLAAALQALTAVALVSVLLVALNATGLQVKLWAGQLETASYALVAVVGLSLLCAELLRLWRRRRARSVGAAQAGSHGHHHHHDGHHHHHHDHGHEHGEACGHVVGANDVAGQLSWRKIAAVVFSVGIRPCSGAILVLVFALSQGLFWAGVAATFAMALGTAITVAALATFALGSRELALRLGGGNQAWVDAVWTTCAIGGALAVTMIGLLLFAASLGPARPF